MKTLYTERLILRPWSLDDLDDLYAYARNPNVGPAAGWEPHASREVTMRILQNFVSGEEVWAIALRGSGRAIGSVGLHDDQRRSHVPDVKMLGYVLSEEHWGHGYMPEAVRAVLRHAFEEMGLSLMSVYHYPHNSKSRRVIEKCGFTHEGTLRQGSRIYDGTVYDSVMYSMTRDEYLALSRG